MAEGAVKNEKVEETSGKKQRNQSNNAKSSTLKSAIPKLEGYASSGENVPLDEQTAIKNGLKNSGIITNQQLLDNMFVNGKFNNAVYKTVYGDSFTGVKFTEQLRVQQASIPKEEVIPEEDVTMEAKENEEGGNIATGTVTQRDILNAATHNQQSGTVGNLKYSDLWWIKKNEDGSVSLIKTTQDSYGKKLESDGWERVNSEHVSYLPLDKKAELMTGVNNQYLSEVLKDKNVPPTIKQIVVNEDGSPEIDRDTGQPKTIEIDNPALGLTTGTKGMTNFVNDCVSSSYEVPNVDSVPSGAYYIEKDGKIYVIKEQSLGSDSHRKMLKEAAENEKITVFKQKPKKDLTNEEEQKKDLQPADDQDKPAETLTYDKSDGGNLTIANHKIEYIRANGSTKIKYPITTKYVDIMGLPPLYIGDSRLGSDKIIPFYTNYLDATPSKEAEYYYYEQVKGSFPILKIHPIDIEILKEGVRTKSGNTKLRDKTQDQKNYRGHVLSEVEYKFAVQTSSTIQYSHTNQFGESGVEGSLKKITNAFNTMSQVQNLANAVGGINSELINQISSAAQGIGSRLKGEAKKWQDAAAKSTLAQEHPEIAGVFNSLFNAGMDIMSGGRIDIPDVWIDSNTSNSHTFNIQLRTLSPDPRSDQYFSDILLPMYVLLTLALPTEGQTFMYNTPTYITASLDDSFWEVKFGAITSLNWTIDTNYINFKKVPTHIDVQVTIQDMYKLMPQGVFDIDNTSHTNGHNSDMMTKDDYINNFVNNFPVSKEGQSGRDKIKVPNEAYYLTEFSGLAGYQEALAKKKQEEQASDDNDKRESSGNAKGGNKSPVSKAGEKALTVSGDKLGTDSKLPEGVERAVALDKKTNSFATSVGNVITGITTGIKNITAGVNKAIPTVKEIISKGKTVLNTVNNLKASIKCTGKTTNLEGILNGSFTSSISTAFDNLGNAGDALSSLTNGALTNSKTGKSILSDISNVAKKSLTLDLPSTVSEDGKSCNFIDQIKSGISTVRAVGKTASTLMGAVSSTKGIINASNGLDPLSRIQGYANAVSALADGADYADRLWQASKQSAVDHKCYTAGQITSNAKLQDKLKANADAVAEDAVEVTKKIVNTGTLDYLTRQPWFKSGVRLKTGATGDKFSDYEFRDPDNASLLSDQFDAGWNIIKDGTATLFDVSGDVAKDATLSGIANASGLQSTIVVGSNDS